jgi:hypothetical protein
MYVLRRILNPMGTANAIEFLLDKLRQTKKRRNDGVVGASETVIESILNGGPCRPIRHNRSG